ncbi:hypothetical protein D3C81_2019630 [compost metagenome]
MRMQCLRRLRYAVLCEIRRRCTKSQWYLRDVSRDQARFHLLGKADADVDIFADVIDIMIGQYQFDHQTRIFLRKCRDQRRQNDAAESGGTGNP